MALHPTTKTPRVKRGVILAAGIGRRMYPISRVIPKEMLPLGRKPMAEHIIDELRMSGINEVLFVISSNKDIIPKYFGDGSSWEMHFTYVIQQEMRGPGDALLYSERWAQRDPFVVCFGDTIVNSAPECEVSPLSRLIEVFTEQRADLALLVDYVASAHAQGYAIILPAVSLRQVEPFQVRNNKLDEPNNLADVFTLVGAGRWLCPPSIFDGLKQAKPYIERELILPDALKIMLATDANIWAVPLREGESRHDLGTWSSYLTATISAAMNDIGK